MATGSSRDLTQVLVNREKHPQECDGLRPVSIVASDFASGSSEVPESFRVVALMSYPSDLT